MIAISNLNTYNFAFIMAGLLPYWRPKRFLVSVAQSVPATGGVLIQFPFYGAIAAILTQAKNSAGLSVSDQIADVLCEHIDAESVSAGDRRVLNVMGFFIPSGGGKWLLEAPYVMQYANDLQVHLGWAADLQRGEALPNLINLFWMLPLLGVLGLRARDIVGFTFLQLLVHLRWCCSPGRSRSRSNITPRGPVSDLEAGMKRILTQFRSERRPVPWKCHSSRSSS